LNEYTNYLTTRYNTRSDYLGDIKALSMVFGAYIVFTFNYVDASVYVTKYSDR